MIQLEFTEEERAFLIELLENDINELRAEIAKTDRRDFREMLKRRETLMKKMQQEFTHASREGVGE